MVCVKTILPDISSTCSCCLSLFETSTVKFFCAGLGYIFNVLLLNWFMDVGVERHVLLIDKGALFTLQESIVLYIALSLEKARLVIIGVTESEFVFIICGL